MWNAALGATLLSRPDRTRARYLASVIRRQIRLRNRLLWRLGYEPATLVRPSAEELVEIIDGALRAEVSALVARGDLEAAIQATTDLLRYEADAFGFDLDQP